MLYCITTVKGSYPQLAWDPEQGRVWGCIVANHPGMAVTVPTLLSRSIFAMSQKFTSNLQRAALMDLIKSRMFLRNVCLCPLLSRFYLVKGWQLWGWLPEGICVENTRVIPCQINAKIFLTLLDLDETWFHNSVYGDIEILGQYIP